MLDIFVLKLRRDHVGATTQITCNTRLRRNCVPIMHWSVCLFVAKFSGRKVQEFYSSPGRRYAAVGPTCHLRRECFTTFCNVCIA